MHTFYLQPTITNTWPTKKITPPNEAEKKSKIKKLAALTSSVPDTVHILRKGGKNKDVGKVGIQMELRRIQP